MSFGNASARTVLSSSSASAVNFLVPTSTLTLAARTCALFVPTLAGDQIAAITWFADSGGFPQFGCRGCCSRGIRRAHHDLAFTADLLVGTAVRKLQRGR